MSVNYSNLYNICIPEVYVCFVCDRIRSSDKNVGKWPTWSIVFWWHEKTVSHSRKTTEKGQYVGSNSCTSIHSIYFLSVLFLYLLYIIKNNITSMLYKLSNLVDCLDLILHDWWVMVIGSLILQVLNLGLYIHYERDYTKHIEQKYCLFRIISSEIV
jgi:hypothetical protein